jgi:hypothetical protein
MVLPPGMWWLTRIRAAEWATAGAQPAASHKGNNQWRVNDCRILFHPDYNRRLWSLTRSADPLPQWKGRSRAPQDDLGYRRWGVAPRPENKRAYDKKSDGRCQHLSGMVAENTSPRIWRTFEILLKLRVSGGISGLMFLNLCYCHGTVVNVGAECRAAPVLRYSMQCRGSYPR